MVATAEYEDNEWTVRTVKEVAVESGDGVVVTATPGEDLLCERHPGDLTPDIEHPATRGWLLAMLREAHNDDGADVSLERGWDNGEPYFSAVIGDGPHPDAPTEGEALARALLAAWGDS